MAGIRVLRTIVVSDTTRAILDALLKDSKCSCGQDARRVTFERDPVSIDYSKPGAYRVRLKHSPLVIRSWCGDVESHKDDYGGSREQWQPSGHDPKVVALTEDDM